MCEAVGHRVVELERVAFGPLGLRGLERGRSRRLKDAEVERLRRAAGPKRAALTQSRAVQLRALRGAITVEANDAGRRSCPRRRSSCARSSVRNEPRLTTTSSAASSPAPATSTPSSPRWRRATWASATCRCCAPARCRCPGSLPRVIRLLMHCYCDPAHRAQPRLPARGGRPAQGPPRRPMTGIEFNRHIETSRSTRRRPPTRSRASWSSSPRTRRPTRRTRRCSRRSRRSCARSTATPTPRSRCCGAASPSAPASRSATSRSATAPARSCWRPPTRCSSRAPRSSTPGRRSRSTRSWRRCPARPRSPCRSTTPASTTWRRWPPRSPPPRGW